MLDQQSSKHSAADNLDWCWIDALIAQARLEDLGPDAVDITSACLVPLAATCQAHLRAREAGTLAGVVLLPRVLAAYDSHIGLTLHARDGDAVEAGQVIAVLEGRLASVLAAERVALNFLSHLSGIATLTRTFVDAVQGTKAAIYDTRKTLPGWRDLAKYAVRCGGGVNHRMGLHDAVLIKDNHIAHIPSQQLRALLADAVRAARQSKGHPPAFVEVEVDTVEQFRQVITLAEPVDVILLDNMSLADMSICVSLRDQSAPAVKLEASGGVNMQSVRAVAQTGVDRIAIGALTHSVTALDIGLDIEPVGG